VCVGLLDNAGENLVSKPSNEMEAEQEDKTSKDAVSSLNQQVERERERKLCQKGSSGSV